MNAVTAEDMRAVALKLVEMAKEGHVQAIRELIDRCVGKPHEADLIERIEQLEERLVAMQREPAMDPSPWG